MSGVMPTLQWGWASDWVLRSPLPSAHRREVQEYIPAQLYHTTAGDTWLNLVSQHRQQTQALSPHQARAQFLGESWLGGGLETWEGKLS